MKAFSPWRIGTPFVGVSGEESGIVLIFQLLVQTTEGDFPSVNLKYVFIRYAMCDRVHVSRHLKRLHGDSILSPSLLFDFFLGGKRAVLRNGFFAFAASGAVVYGMNWWETRRKAQR